MSHILSLRDAARAGSHAANGYRARRRAGLPDRGSGAWLKLVGSPCRGGNINRRSYLLSWASRGAYSRAATSERAAYIRVPFRCAPRRMRRLWRGWGGHVPAANINAVTCTDSDFALAPDSNGVTCDTATSDRRTRSCPGAGTSRGRVRAVAGLGSPAYAGAGCGYATRRLDAFRRAHELGFRELAVHGRQQAIRVGSHGAVGINIGTAPLSHRMGLSHG